MIDFRYIKNFKDHTSAYGKSTDITPNALTAGRRIVIYDTVKEHAGKEATIVGIAGNDVNKYKVKLIDSGKVITITKDDIRM